MFQIPIGAQPVHVAIDLRRGGGTTVAESLPLPPTPSIDLASALALANSDIASATSYVRVAGGEVPGDGGAGIYLRGPGQVTDGDVRSLDGAWWRLDTGGRQFTTPAAMLASTIGKAGTGYTWQAGGFRYAETATNATDHHLVTLGGVRLRALPDNKDQISADQFPAASGETSDTPRLLRLFAAADASGDNIFLPAGTYQLAIASAADVLRAPAGCTITFAPNAVIEWGMQDVYYPAIAVFEDHVTIEGARLRWTGSLTSGAGTGFDFVSPNDDAGDDGFDRSDTANRFGTNNFPRTRAYCAGIYVYEAASCRILNFRGDSQAGDASSVIHAWISAGRMNSFTVDGAEFDDCCLGILTTGGDGEHRFENLRCGRMNQDFGIPGHILYTFARGKVIVRNIQDNGEETTSIPGRYSSHTVSMRSSDALVVVDGITSRRSAGALALRDNQEGATVSNINWRLPDTPVGNFGESGGALRFITSTLPKSAVLSNIHLDGRDGDIALLAGAVETLTGRSILLRRDSSGGQTSPWIQLKGGFGGNQGSIDVDATLEETSGSAVTTIASTNGNLLTNGLFRLKLVGWGTHPPSLDITSATNSRFHLSFDGDHDGYLGTPDQVFPGATEFRLKVNQVFLDPAGVTPWKVAHAATSQISQRIPLAEGLHEITMTVIDAEAPGATRTETHRVWLSRPNNANAETGSEHVGVVRGTNTGHFGDFTVTASFNGYADIDIPVHNTTVQSHGTTLFIASQHLARF